MNIIFFITRIDRSAPICNANNSEDAASVCESEPESVFHQQSNKKAELSANKSLDSISPIKVKPTYRHIVSPSESLRLKRLRCENWCKNK